MLLPPPRTLVNNPCPRPCRQPQPLLSQAFTSRTDETAEQTRRRQIDRRQRRWKTDPLYRNYSCLIGRTYASHDAYTVWPWRPEGEFVKHPSEVIGRRLELWQGLAKHSDPPSESVARMAVALIDKYVRNERPRNDYWLPVFPTDQSY